MSLVEKIQKVRLEFQSDVKSLSSKNGELDQIRIKYLSRKGSIANLFNQLERLLQRYHGIDQCGQQQTV